MSTIAVFEDGSSVTWRLLTSSLLRPLLPPLPPRLLPPLRRRPPPAVLEATNLATPGTGGFPDVRASAPQPPPLEPLPPQWFATEPAPLYPPPQSPPPPPQPPPAPPAPPAPPLASAEATPVAPGKGRSPTL